MQHKLKKTRRSLLLPCFLAPFLGVLASGQLYSQPNASCELIVDGVAQGSESAHAKLQSGDRIDSWQRSQKGDDQAKAWNTICSPLTIDKLELLAAGHGKIMLKGSRSGKALSWELRPGDWGLQTRPLGKNANIDAVLERLNAGNHAQSDANQKEILALRNEFIATGDYPNAAWLLTRLIRSAADQSEWDSVRKHIDYLRHLPDADSKVLALASLLQYVAKNAPLSVIEQLGSLIEKAADHAAVSAASHTLALLQLGTLESKRDQLELAEGHLELALKLIREHAPDGYAQAQLTNSFGDLDRARGHLTRAAQRYTDAVGILEALPGAAARLLAHPFRNLGTVAVLKGELNRAEELYLRSLALTKSTEGENGTASVLNNLGIVSVRRGDMHKGEYYYQMALAINERNQAWLSYNRNLFNLADIAYARGDFRKSEFLFDRVLKSIGELSPNGVMFAQTMATLAHSQFELGKLAEAKKNYDQSIKLYQRIAPDSLEAATAMLGLGDIALHKGNLELATREFSRAVAVRKRHAPTGADLAEAYWYLASADRAAERLTRARRNLHRALTIQEAAAPGSVAHAQTLYSLASLHQKTGQTDKALQRYEQSVAALESQTQRLGGADASRTQFTAKYSKYFKEYIDLLLATGDTKRAFHVLERYRARSLLAMLAEREMSLNLSLPPDLARERRAREQAYAATQDELIDLSNAGASAKELSAAHDRLTLAEVKRDGLSQRIRAVAENFADLRYPVALQLNDVQQALDEGTVALSYHVGRKQTTLFIVSRDSFQTQFISVSAAELREKVTRFRFLIDAGRHDSSISEPLRHAASDLYDLLVPPMQTIAAAKRILLVPDGPLHALPFAALMTRNASSSTAGGRYLVEAYPLHRTLSLTLYAGRRKKAALHAEQASVVAFADPSTASNWSSDGYVSGVRADARNLPQLPWSRDEVNFLGKIFAGPSSIYIGDAATEEQFKASAPTADILHVAAHAIIDESSPLDSALVLSLPVNDTAAENGLLQSWEIFEQLQTHASLVVLSACQTASGREASGEGMLGLKRAFQFAGARTVMASLWNISDRSTSDLMAAFYRAFSAGLSKDAALRSAQLKLLGHAELKGMLPRWLHTVQAWLGLNSKFEHPYHWAAFHITGDYR